MELSQPFLLEELVAMRRENWSTYPTEVVMNDLCTNGWSCDFIDGSNDVPVESTAFSMPLEMDQYFDAPLSEMYNNTLDDVNNFIAPETIVVDQFNLPYEIENDIMPLLQQPIQDHYTTNTISLIIDEEFSTFLSNAVDQRMEEETCGGFKVEKVTVNSSPNENLASFKSSSGTTNKDRRNGVKKVDGQPSKNLMAERRRRKRLNDRLSMLRSIVPRISKMDRTSILADTIDYMKELLEKVSKLEGEEDDDQNGAAAINKLKELRSNEGQAKNSPKFEVKMGERDTRIDICCTPKPGLLISTVNTLEALGLEIQQCVISCFNDFSMQAACSQVSAEQAALTTEEIKQALFRNAGYEGRCL